MTDTDHTDGSVDDEALTERFSPPVEAGAPSPEAEPPPEPARSKRLVITASVLAICIVAAAVALFLLAGNDTETADAAPAETSTTTTDATTTTELTTTTEAATTTAAPAPPPTAPPARNVLNEPSGQFCRDLNAKGYSYAEAVSYWEHYGRPTQMDASGMGIPCQTVYPSTEVEAHWGPNQVSRDLATLQQATSSPWTETMLRTLGASFCNDWEHTYIGDSLGDLTERGKSDWAAFIAPQLGVGTNDARRAIETDVWNSYITCN